MLVDKMTEWGFLSTSRRTRSASLSTWTGIDRKYLSHAIVVLLTGRAEIWFRTSGLQGGAWTEVRREFLDFFLPPRYYQRLDDGVRSHFQGSNEPFKERLKMRRPGLSPEQELERVYENMLPEYKMFTRRQDFGALTVVTHLVVNFKVARSREGRTSRGYMDTENASDRQISRPLGNPTYASPAEP